MPRALRELFESRQNTSNFTPTSENGFTLPPQSKTAYDRLMEFVQKFIHLWNTYKRVQARNWHGVACADVITFSVIVRMLNAAMSNNSNAPGDKEIRLLIQEYFGCTRRTCKIFFSTFHFFV